MSWLTKTAWTRALLRRSGASVTGRIAEPKGDLRLPAAELAFALVYLLVSLVAIRLTRATEGVALIWPANAIAAALIIRVSRLRASLSLLLVGLAVVAANTLSAGDSLLVAVGFALVNVAEIGLAIWVYRSLVKFPIPSINVNHAAHMTAVLGLAIPGVAAAFGGALLHVAFGQPWWASTAHWWLADALGMCLFAPPVILYRSDLLRRLVSRKFIAGNLILALICLVSCYVAIRYVSFPFIIMSVPLMIAAFRLGGLGTAILSLLCGLLILALWLAGILPHGLSPNTQTSTLALLPIWALISTLMLPVAVGIGSDDRRLGARKLRQSEGLLKTTLLAIGNGVITTDPEQRITYMNAAAREILGQTLADVESRRFDEVTAIADAESSRPVPDLVGRAIALGKVMRAEKACILHRPDGAAIHVMVSVSPLSGSEGRITGAVIVLQDATERYQHDQELNRQATRDALTGLGNRVEYQRRAKRAFHRARLLDECAVVIAIDLDRFKAVNDAGGHGAGDAVLSRIGAVLQSLVRPTDTVARMGGDEFAVILESCAPERISAVAEQILHGLNPLRTSWQGTMYETGASIGVAAVSSEMEDESAWLTAADQACYAAKRAGRGMLAIKGAAVDLRQSSGDLTLISSVGQQARHVAAGAPGAADGNTATQSPAERQAQC